MPVTRWMRRTRNAAVALFIMIGAPTVTSAAQDAARPSPEELLKDLCRAVGRKEPACDALAELSSDEAWLVLRAACRTDNSEACQRFRMTQGIVLELDARTTTWRAWREGHAVDLSLDVAGVPTLRLMPSDAPVLKVVVRDISPLAYSATAGKPTEDDLAVIAGLKTVFALAGTAVQALVQAAAFSAPTALGKSKLLMSDRVGGILGLEAGKCVVNPPDDTVFEELVRSRNQLLQGLKDRIQALDTQLEAVDRSRGTFVRSVQKVEDRRELRLAEIPSVDLAALENAYDAADTEADTVMRDPTPGKVTTVRLASCEPMLAAYSALLAASADLTVVREHGKRVRAAQAVCAIEELRAAVLDNMTRLENQCQPDTHLAAALKLHAAVLKPEVDRLATASQVEEKVWQAIEKSRSARNQISLGAATLSRQAERARKHTWNGLLVRELVVTRPNPKLPWSKVQSHSVIVKAATPYAAQLTLAYPEEQTHAYKLESAFGRVLGYGIGLVYTPLHESTWTAVSVPGTEQKVIGETGRATRAGDLAAFVTYRFTEHRPTTWRVRPTLDFGVGITSDRPAFFLGGGVEIWGAARIGIGWAPQRVTKLADGQVPGETIVASTDEIRTVKEFEAKNWYVSFAFALDSLSLFKKD